MAIGFTSGDERKLNVAGGTMTGPLILNDGYPAVSEDYVADAVVAGVQDVGELADHSSSAATAAVTPSAMLDKITRYDTSTGTINQTLPAATVGDMFAVGWDSGANAITLTAAGSDTIGPVGATTFVVPLLGDVITFRCSQTGRWRAVSGYRTLTALDGRYLGPGGGTLTGPLVLAGDPTAPLQPATKQYVDAIGTVVFQVNAPTGNPAVDTAAIQSALSAAQSATRGHVVLRAGVYAIQAGSSASQGGVRAYDNTLLTGQGVGVTTLKVVNGTTANISGIVRTPSAVVTKNVTLRDFTIDGNKGGLSGAPTIIGFYAGTSPLSTDTDEDIVCERVEIKNCTDYGFDPHERVTRLRFTDCLSHDNNQDGFTLDGCYDFIVEGCTSYANGRHGFNFVTGSARGEVTGCRALSNVNNGFVTQQGAKYIEFSNCRAEGNSVTGWVLNGVAQTAPQLDTTPGGFHVLNGCRSRASGLHGFQLVGATGVQLIGCRSADASQTTNNTSSHFRLAESGTTYTTDTTLVGCTWYQTAGVTNAAKYGIEEQSSSNGPTHVVGCHGSGTATGSLNLLNATSALLQAHNGTDGTHPASYAYSFDTPSRHALKEWNFPPDLAGASAGVVAVSGTIYGVRVDAQQTAAIGTISVVMGTVAAGLTSGQCIATVIDCSTSTAAEVARSADISALFGSNGTISIPLVSPFTPVSGRAYAVLFLFNGTTPPSLIRSSATGVTGPNTGQGSTSPRRYFTAGTAQTSVPTSVVLSSTTATGALAWWVGLS